VLKLSKVQGYIVDKHKKYNIALKALIKSQRQLNIVIVGANDGKINDPIYSFVKEHLNSTNVLLVEPLKLIIPFLESNYAFHPSHQIANCAIGKEGILTLFAVKQEFWDEFQPGYAKSWPFYRAASGITSAIKAHLEKCLVRQNIDPNKAIRTLEIPSKELRTLLTELSWGMQLDVLQIDAEGYDDIVIYNSNISLSKPKLIYFESHNMPNKKSEPLKEFLFKHNYKTYLVGGNSLAVKKSFSVWYFKVIWAIKTLGGSEKI